jgi:hypothetical protein
MVIKTVPKSKRDESEDIKDLKSLNPPPAPAPPPPPPPPPPIEEGEIPSNIMGVSSGVSGSPTTKMATPPKRRVARVYLDSYHYTFYEIEAKKRNMSLSELFKAAIYDFLFKTPTPLTPGDVPILKMIPRIDRSSKGIPIKTSRSTSPSVIAKKIGSERGEFAEVIDDLKAFDITRLKKIPEDDLVNPPRIHDAERLDDKDTEVDEDYSGFL